MAKTYTLPVLPNTHCYVVVTLGNMTRAYPTEKRIALDFALLALIEGITHGVNPTIEFVCPTIEEANALMAGFNFMVDAHIAAAKETAEIPCTSPRVPGYQ